MTLPALVALAGALLLAGPAQAKEHRSQAARHHFMQAQPCPGGPDAGSTKRCRGYVIDHVRPLACAGADAPSNMQWQTLAEGKAKDLWERRGCGR